MCDEKKFGEAEEILADIRSAQVPREYYEELRETVRVGLQEQRARERAERAEAARKIREDRDKKRQQEREAAKAKKKNNTPLAGNARGPVNVTPHGLLAGTVRLLPEGQGTNLYACGISCFLPPLLQYRRGT